MEKRLLAIILAVMMLTGIAAGQSPRERDKSDTSNKVKSVPTHISIQPDEKEGEKYSRDAQTPDNEVGESYTNPNEEAASERTARRRVRPEHPRYFMAQYALRYDDNVVFGDTDKRRDIVSLPQMAAGLQHVTKRSSTRIDYSGGAEIYHRTSSLSGALHSINFNYEYDLARHTTLLLDDYFLTRPNPSRFSPLTVAALPVTAGVPNNGALNALISSRSTFNQFTIGLLQQLSRYSTLRGTFGYTLTRFAGAGLIDNSEQFFELGYARQYTRTRSFELAYRLSRFSADSSSLSNSLIPSFSYQRNQRLRFQFGAGPQVVTTEGRNLLFWSALAEATYIKSRRTSLAFNYNAGVGTGGGLANITRNHTVFGTVNHNREKLQLEARVGFSRATGVGNAGGPLLAAGSANKTLIIETQLSHPIGEKSALFFNYTHAHQFGSGTLGSNAISRNQFSVGINFDTRRSSHSRQVRTIR